MFESGNRVQDTLADLAGIMGTRDAAICREMTKLHEEILRAPVAELAAAADTLETRGEFVLVIGPPAARAQVMTEDGAGRSAAQLAADATASRMRWRMRSNCPAGRAAKSMPARSNSPRRRTSKQRAAMAKTDGAAPPDKLAKIASPERVAAFRTGLSAEARAAAFLMAKGYRILAKRFRTPLWRDRPRGAQAQSGGVHRGQGARQPG